MTRQRTQDACGKSVEAELDVWARFRAALDDCNAAEAAIDQANRDLIRDLGEQFRRMG